MEIPHSSIDLSAIRSSGPGGQHVNKTASAIHLRLDLNAIEIRDEDMARLLKYSDRRISEEGIITIKAQNARSQSRNKADALERLQELLQEALRQRKTRKKTRPSFGSKRRARKQAEIDKEKKAFRSKVQF